MKLDFDRAWRETMQMLSANKALLAIIAGLFVFLPYALALLLIPELATASAAPTGAGTEEATAAMLDLYRRYWWVFIALLLLQGVGTLAMLALLKRQARPTVADALRVGVAKILSYVAAQMLTVIGIGLIAGVILAVSAASGLSALAVIGGAIGFVLGVYIFVKVSMVGPVLAIEDITNPLTSLRRSWQLTRGNSIRLLIFFLLILIAIIIVATIVSMVLGLVFALLGDGPALFGNAVTAGIINAAVVVLFTCVMAAVHAQLARLQSRSEPAEA